MADAAQVLAEVQRKLEEASERSRPIPEATPRGPARRLTVGMATYDDYDGVFFTIQAIRLYHAELVDEIEFVVIDNHPEGLAAPFLKQLERHFPGAYRYVPFRGFRGTAVRDQVFREASGEIVVCVDSHVLLAPGALRALVDHFDRSPGTLDLVQGPLRRDRDRLATHYDPRWRGGMFGVWDFDERGADPSNPPFEITAHGLGVFACRREAWPGFNPRFRGFGGIEGYIHEKVRQRGGRVLCHPALVWVHRFERPTGLPYSAAWEDRIRNFMIGWNELGLDTAEVESHYREHLGAEVTDRILAEVQAEISSPLHALDGIICTQANDHIDEWPQVREHFAMAYVGRMAERLPSANGASKASAHEAAVAEAERRDLRTFLVCEAGAVLRDNAVSSVRAALEDGANASGAIDLCRGRAVIYRDGSV